MYRKSVDKWPGFDEVSTQEVKLFEVYRPQIAAIAPSLERALKDLKSDFSCDRTIASRDHIDTFLGDVTAVFQDIDDKLVEAVRADIEEILTRLLNSYSLLDVSLFTTDDNMCSLFHMDMVHLRLICTYAGPATEWLKEVDANRSGLGKGSNDKILNPGGQVNRLSTGSIGFLKGARFRGLDGKGVIHKSPAIEGTGTRRLVLRVDVR